MELHLDSRVAVVEDGFTFLPAEGLKVRHRSSTDGYTYTHFPASQGEKAQRGLIATIQRLRILALELLRYLARIEFSDSH